jgi:PAS domain S-box-containing protein
MNYYALIPLGAFLIHFFTWTYVFAQRRWDSINRSYLIFSGALCGWLLLNFILWLPMDDQILGKLINFNLIAWLPIGVLFMNFCYTFLGRRKDIVYYGFVTLLLLVLVLSYTTKWVAYDYYKMYWGPMQYMGFLYVPASFMLIAVPVIYSAILVYKKYRQIRGASHRRQLTFVMIGAVLSTLSGVILEVVLQGALHQYDIVPLGSTSTIFLSIFVFLAVINYQFLSNSIEDVALDMFYKIPDGLIICDAKASIKHMNLAAQRILGVTYSQLERTPIVSLFDQYDFDKEYDKYITPLTNNNQIIVAITQADIAHARSSKGKVLIIRDVTENLQVQKELAAHRDHLEEMVSERTLELQAANARLRESEERSRALIENSFGLIYEINREGIILEFSPNCTAVLGYRPDEIIRHKGSDFVHPEDLPAAIARIKSLNNGPSGETMVYRFRHKNGEWRWLECLEQAYITASGENRYIYVARDITERKRIEEDLIRANKIESIGLLAGGIAHDFNNILGIIWGNISLAKTSLLPEHPVYQILVDSERGFIRARELTQQLLTFAKGGAPIRRPADIGELLRESTSLALRGANTGVIYQLSAELWMAEVDENQISQVFNNILINADQAMPDGGMVEVKAENVVVESTMGIPLKEGRFVRVSIKDTGMGITKESIARVFDPFFTTKAAGSGLGLTTAYSIVHRHNGYISFESEPGEGTKFIIYLPASEDGPVLNKEIPAIVQTGKGRLLLMDDEEDLLAVAKVYLSKMGFDVTTVTDGALVIDYYQNAILESHRYDLVVMDLTVPGGMGGKETIEKLLMVDPDIKAIVTSGYSDDPVMAEYEHHGFCAVLPKPYTPERLLELVNKLLREKGDTNLTA